MPPPRSRPPAMKALATQAYTMGNMSCCSIARLFGVSDVAVLKWKRGKTRELPERKVESEQVNLMLDEMWHFIQKKNLQAPDMAGLRPCGSENRRLGCGWQ
jgi:transposase